MNRNVMVVDDEHAVRFSVGKILENADFDVTLAEDGPHCIDEVRAGFKGLILMDVMMPEMDGWDTIKAIADEGFMEGIVICMMTALPEPEPKMEMVKEYVLDYLRKPFTTAEILEKVERLLDIVSAGQPS